MNRLGKQDISITLFEGIQRETLEALLAQGGVRNYKRDQMVFMDHDDLREVYISLSGSYSLYKLASNGEKKAIFHFDRGYILNEGIVTDIPSSINCQTFQEGRVYFIDRLNFLDLMEKDKVLWQNVMAMWERRIRRLYRQLKNTATSIRMDKRLAAKLWKLSRDFGLETSQGVSIDLSLSITYLSELVGAKRETISRQMKVLVEEGLIKQEGKKIIIPSRKALQEYFKMD